MLAEKLPVSGRKKHFNGYAILVAMMRELDPKTRNQLLGKLRPKAPILARIIDECDFVYRDIIYLTDKSLQELFKKFSTQEWLVAWKLTDKALQKRILNNLSDTKKLEFVTAVKGAGKVRKSSVYATQNKIAREARRLLMFGKLSRKQRIFFL